MMFISVVLPQPGGADNRDEFAVAHLEVEIGDDVEPTLVRGEALADVLNVDLGLNEHSATARPSCFRAAA